MQKIGKNLRFSSSNSLINIIECFLLFKPYLESLFGMLYDSAELSATANLLHG